MVCEPTPKIDLSVIQRKHEKTTNQSASNSGLHTVGFSFHNLTPLDLIFRSHWQVWKYQPLMVAAPAFFYEPWPSFSLSNLSLIGLLFPICRHTHMDEMDENNRRYGQVTEMDRSNPLPWGNRTSKSLWNSYWSFPRWEMWMYQNLSWKIPELNFIAGKIIYLYMYMYTCIYIYIHIYRYRHIFVKIDLWTWHLIFFWIGTSLCSFPSPGCVEPQ